MWDDSYLATRMPGHPWTNHLNVNPLECNSMDSRIPLENSHSYQLWICDSQKKRNNTISQMRLRSVFKMRTSILNTATTEQMGYLIFFFFRLLPNLQISIFLWKFQVIEYSYIDSICKLIWVINHSLIIFVVSYVSEFHKNCRHFCIF